MAIKTSLINMKGGVGKSTLTVNLAWHFAAYQYWAKKVLVIDLDPQFNASQYLLGVTEYERLLNSKKATVWEIFEQGTRTPAGTLTIDEPLKAIKTVYSPHSGGKIDLIASRLELAFSLKNPGTKEQKLSKFVNQIEKNYDLIFIDCAPTESVLTTAAYLTSDFLLVPVKPEYLSSIGLPLLVNSMREFKNDYDNRKLELAGVVFNSADDYYPEGALSKSTVRDIARKNGWYVFDNEVPYSRSFPKGAREGEPLFRTSYSRWNKVNQFDSFAKEFANRIGL
jgi:chromosome partitioning protein